MSRLTKSEILLKLADLKTTYKKEGIIIVGLFGSYAKDEAKEDSDIDILYDINSDVFCQKYPGFKAFSRLQDIKEELQNIFNTKIDLATIDNDSKTFSNYALKDEIYV